MTLRNRIALAGGLAVMTALLPASLVLYPAADRDLHDRLDSSLLATAQAAPKFVRDADPKPTQPPGTVPDSNVFDIGGTLVQILAPPLPNAKATPLGPVSGADLAVAARTRPGFFSTVSYSGRDYRLYTSPFENRAGALVRVAEPLSGTAAALRTLQILLAALVGGGTLVAAVAARILAGRVLRPVSRLTRTVERVAATGDLSTGIDTTGRDEIGRLARSFTTMMSALEESVDAQRRLVADASHELRTPLTSLTTNLEMLAEPGGLTITHAPALVRSAREQSRELKTLINDLVDLARYGQGEHHAEDLRLDLLARDVVDRAARHAPALHFELCLPDNAEACLVHADSQAIARALGNLLDNAAKWSPPQGIITVDITNEPHDVVCTVTDQGPGIPRADLPRVFDRFYRSAAARAQPGSGLGLSIVRQIADIHGGSVTAQPSPTGTAMRLSIPRTP